MTGSMAPHLQPTVIDLWAHSINYPRIVVDILMPNSVLIPLEVNRDATLLEIKEDVFEEAQRYPLFGMLRDMQSYSFTYVNFTTAEQEEITDENRRLCDVRPFQAVLRIVEKKGDKAEKQLNCQIGHLIGKGLHEFDALKNPEVNDFRWKMRTFCENIARQREGREWLDKVRYQYPPHLEHREEIPEYLVSKMKNGYIILTARMENSDASFTLQVPHTITPAELLQQILIKKANATGHEERTGDYILKVCGMEEYLLWPYPLIKYKYICEMVSAEKIPNLVVTSVGSIQLDLDNVYESLEELETKRSRSFYGSTTLGRKKQATVSSWTIEEPFLLIVNMACKLNCGSSAKVAVQAGLYHGGEPLCEVLSTPVSNVDDGECKWDDNLQFDIGVCDIPRMARLCFVVYEVTQSPKGSKSKKYKTSFGEDINANPIAWVNTTVYDFKNVLKTGMVTLHMWTYSQDPQAEDMLNHLGTVVSNPETDQATALIITFNSYNVELPIVYPSYDKVIEAAAAIKLQNTDSAGYNRPHASKSYLEQLRQICERDPLHQMHEQEKELLWFLREDCCHVLPHSLPKLLHCLKWNDRNDVAQITALLQIWPKLPPEQALELLDYAYADQAVRSYALSCLKDISDEDLSLYLLQLVQALKHESYLHCDLVEFLLKRALNNQHIGHSLFWLLRSEMHVPSVSVRYGVILEAYCRGSVEHMKALGRQVEALQKLKSLNEHIQQEANKRKEGRDKLRVMMHEEMQPNYFQDTFMGLLCPLDPRYRLSKIRIEKCRFMDSKMKPLWLVFGNEDEFGPDVYILYKNGDDLRQDMLTLQMIRIMDKLWKDEGLDLRMIPYGCIATDYKVGLIEVVLNADTIANIQKEKGFTATSAFKKRSLLAWLKENNPNEASLKKAIREFTLSCAGYCVATYVLGIADRHSDNIMVRTNGQLFHIDFGHILGKFKEKFGIRRERVPFVLTHDFVHVITRGHTQKSQEFNRFQQYCERAFMILRKKGSLIISLFAMMLNTGIPELTGEKDLDYLRETLVLDMTEAEALRHFRSKFDEALRNSWKTSVNWLAHNLAKDNKMD